MIALYFDIFLVLFIRTHGVKVIFGHPGKGMDIILAAGLLKNTRCGELTHRVNQGNTCSRAQKL